VPVDWLKALMGGRFVEEKPAAVERKA
jgi:hypothetical protein